MEITDWKHLPYPGALLDQPDWWLEDMLTLSNRAGLLREMLKPQKP